jgi:predicted Zn-dependent peptidase
MLLKHAFNASYQPWEFLRGASFVESETAAALGKTEEQLFDALYSTAYRSSGLGNSLFAKQTDLEGLSRKDLSAFAAENFTLDRMSLIGLGVSHSELEALVGETMTGFSVPKASSALAPKKAHYYGGEARLDAGTSAEAHYLLAYPAGSISSSSSYPATLVLKALLDGKQRTKYGAATGNACLLASASASETRVDAFSTAHTDAGLFGFHVHGHNEQVLSVLQKSLSALKSVAANGAEVAAVERAKKTAIVDLEDSLTRSGQIEFAAEQLTAFGSLRETKDWDALIQKVSAADVQKVCLVFIFLSEQKSLTAHPLQKNNSSPRTCSKQNPQPLLSETFVNCLLLISFKRENITMGFFLTLPTLG